MRLRLKYEYFFGKIEDIDTCKIELRNKISKSSLLYFIPFIIKVSTKDNELKVFSDWFSEANTGLRERVVNEIGNGNAIINTVSSYKLAEYLFEYENNLIEIEDENFAEIEVPLFKLYLLFNSEQDLLEESTPVDVSDMEIERELEPYYKLLKSSFHSYDLWDISINDHFFTTIK